MVPFKQNRYRMLLVRRILQTKGMGHRQVATDCHLIFL